jgi:hypothetical protein
MARCLVPSVCKRHELKRHELRATWPVVLFHLSVLFVVLHVSVVLVLFNVSVVLALPDVSVVCVASRDSVRRNAHLGECETHLGLGFRAHFGLRFRV